ncbi:ABC transporter permease [Alteromonas oceanisediminis]|uniref:ABC transporter permease n=1 Tax=Alteromonas oceanisediminis TaxID=2836180 RepID=UPI001BDAADAE|nr:ABC transporter permease [Alteromonas oceanisediminis]MBT0585062.1 ABC transporter permease [Alteromonas oceanisediminis]
MTSVILQKRTKWQIWQDVIFALFIREIRTGFNDKFGLSWAVINPVAFIVVLSSIRGFINGPYTHSLPTFTFMAIGVLFIQSFLRTLNSCASSIKKNKALFAFRQVQPISAVIAAALFEFLVKIFSATSILVIMYFIGLEIQISDGLSFIANFTLMILLACSLGLFFGIIEQYVSEIGKIREMVSRPMFFISASFFSLQDIPREFWPYLTWNPVLHAIELTRYALMPSYGNEGVSFYYFCAVVLGVLFLSLAVYFVYWKQAISR